MILQVERAALMVLLDYVKADAANAGMYGARGRDALRQWDELRGVGPLAPVTTHLIPKRELPE